MLVDNQVELVGNPDSVIGARVIHKNDKIHKGPIEFRHRTPERQAGVVCRQNDSNSLVSQHAELIVSGSRVESGGFARMELDSTSKVARAALANGGRGAGRMGTSDFL
jgi:hypothetical protein